MTMRMNTIAAMGLVAAVLAGPVLAQSAMVAAGTAPGKASVAETIELRGTIVSIDAETRVVNLRGEGGNDASMTAGPEVRNFDQLQTGDIVTITMTQALTLELKKGSTAVISRVDDVAGARAGEGEAPAGVIGHKVTVMAEVTALDKDAQTVTLQGPEKSIVLPVRDPAQFALMSVGDRVEATYVEATAVAVEHVAEDD